ncbi:MAG: potassium channel family protein [Peptoniphilaceae bacterium]
MKSFVVFGCGRFGSTIATTLTDLGNEVLIIDIDYDKIQAIADEVTTAIQCDVLDENATNQLGLKNFDTAVIAIGSNLEAAIMATLICKESGIEYILAKAKTTRQGGILRKVGADKIIFPEIDMGNRVAHNLTSNNILDYIQLSPDFSIAEMKVLPDWIDKTIEELHIRNTYKVTILAIERGDEVKVAPSAKTSLKENDILVILGKDNIIKEVERELK